MAKTTAQAFDEFYESIRPSPAMKELVGDRRRVVAASLKKAFPSSSTLQLQSESLIGSFGKRTASRPFKDVDIAAVFTVDTDLWNQTYVYDSGAFISRVRSDLNESTRVITSARGQAVRLFYSEEPWVDVAPLIASNTGGYYIPSGSGSWIKTNPFKHLDHISQRNTELSGNLRRFVRILRQWNQAHSSRLQSFHLEMLAAAAFSNLGSNNREALNVFFGWAKTHLSVDDPAGYSGDLSSYLTDSSRQTVYDSFASAYSRALLALEAENSGNHEESIRQWRIVLGTGFPSYG